MKIRTKTFLIFSGVGIAILFIVIIASSAFSRGVIEDLILSKLSVEASTKASRVEDFLNEKREEVVALSKDHHIADYTLEKLYQDTGDKRSTWDPLGEGVRLYDHSLIALDSIRHTPADEVFILDNKADVILSTDEDSIGKNVSDSNCFAEIQKGKDIYVSDIYLSEVTGGTMINISMPTYHPETGQLFGVLVKKIDVSALSKIVSEGDDNTETGETYLINSAGYMITESRFIEDTILNQQVDTLNAKNCFGVPNGTKTLSEVKTPVGHTEDHEEFANYNNYIDSDVFGTHVFIPETEWCLIVEVGSDEIFKPLDELNFIFILIGIIVALLVLLTSNFIGFKISRPIEKLRSGIEIVESGDLTYKVSTNSDDEIGQLSSAFDRMTENIMKSRKEVNKKVEEQTLDILEKKTNLENQRIALLNILEDVQNEKDKVSTERDKADTILHSIGDGVVVIDEKMNITVFNEEAVRITGYTENEAIGRNYNAIFNIINEKTGEPDNKFVKKTIETGENQSMAELALLKRKDGTGIPIADSSAPIKDNSGKTIGAVIVFRDVTRSRQVEKMRTEFVSVASHQLRTPLTGIQWVVERLLKVSNKLPEEERGYIKDVYFSAKRLSRLVDDLLNVSRVEEGRFLIKMEDVDVVKNIKDYIIEASPLIEKRKVIVNFDNYPEELIIFADRNAIQNIIQSVISNAIEYTPQNGHIDIFLEKKDNSFVFRVKDTGIGIPKGDQSEIFDKFKRGSNAQAVKTDGTGLGLYLTKKITEMLGGKIWFESEESKGTEFFVELPLKSKALSAGSIED